MGANSLTVRLVVGGFNPTHVEKYENVQLGWVHLPHFKGWNIMKNVELPAPSNLWVSGFQLSFNYNMVAKKWAKSKSELQLPLEDHIDGMLNKTGILTELRHCHSV